MIDGAENLEMLFNILHDGSITAGDLVAGMLRLSIEIPYLAERIDPAFASFQVMLHETSDLSFSPWTDGEPGCFHDPAEIFTPELEILGCNRDGERLSIICDRDDTGIGYRGGLLTIEASAASVLDEAGRSLSLDELIALANAAVAEWEAENAARRGERP